MASNLPHQPESYWLDSVSLPRFPPVTEDLDVDVAVIGGGITGVTAAFLLVEEGMNVALVEGDVLLNGTTGHTTAKLTAQHGLFYDELIQKFGLEKAKLYYEANVEAKGFVENTVHNLKIDCDFSEQAAYVYTQDENMMKKIEKEWKAYEKLNIPGSITGETPLPFSVKSAIIMERQAQFHPLKYLSRLVEELKGKGCLIFEQTTAKEVEQGDRPKVKLKNGKTISCDYVISCTHFPFHDEGFYFARMYQERSYVVAALPKKDLSSGMYINAEQPTRSIRYTNYNGDKLLLFSGDHHKTGQGVSTEQHYDNLKTFAENTFGINQVVYRWSAQDLSTLDKVPYIGYVTDQNKRVLVATGFRKWGMTHGNVAALLIRDLILNRENPFKELYTPSRFRTDPSVKRFLQLNADVAQHFVKGKMEHPPKQVKDLQVDEGAVVSVNGKRAGAYKDENGEVFIVDTTCTHMGCELEWNSGERTWDCPCHGSRFSIKGDIVEGPAKRPLKQIAVDEE